MNLSGIINILKKNRNPVSEKTQIRHKMKELKASMSEIQKHAEAVKVFDKIESLPQFRAAGSVLIYWSMPDELPTHNFIIKWCKEKQIFLPVVKGEDMFIRPFSGRENLVKSAYGVWEPDTQRNFEQQVDLVIVPGIAFDKQKNRLGRGKGYYDRYFLNDKIQKWGICFDLQLMDRIPAENFDVKMDKIITSSFLVE